MSPHVRKEGGDTSGQDPTAGTAPGAGETTCPICDGTGKVRGATCKNCGGTGVVTEETGGA
jgi:DnaJ-class molecular chaperone